MPVFNVPPMETVPQHTIDWWSLGWTRESSLLAFTKYVLIWIVRPKFIPSIPLETSVWAFKEVLCTFDTCGIKISCANKNLLTLYGSALYAPLPQGTSLKVIKPRNAQNIKPVQCAQVLYFAHITLVIKSTHWKNKTTTIILLIFGFQFVCVTSTMFQSCRGDFLFFWVEPVLSTGHWVLLKATSQRPQWISN